MLNLHDLSEAIDKDEHEFIPLRNRIAFMKNFT